MAALTGDRQLLHQACVLLLDQHRGLGRIANIRTCITAKRRTHWFYGVTAPLNYLITLARDDGQTVEVLELLESAEKKHQALWAEVVAKDPKREAFLKVRRDCVKDYRERCRMALRIRAHHLGRRLTKEEGEKYLEEQRKVWKKLSDNYALAHPEFNLTELRVATKKFLTERVRKEFNNLCDANFGVERASENKLNQLKRKYGG